ncbi:MAG: MarR family transcriptional regulator [Chloroflexi bacterium]|nr:MarR family transcriptional regulator [Chloroflexota bacterium]
MDYSVDRIEQAGGRQPESAPRQTQDESGTTNTAVRTLAARALRALMQAVALAEPLQRELARRHGVSVGDLIALRRLAQLGEATTARFGEACGVRRSATTDLVDRLESAGLVERCPDPTDRRVRIVRLTEAGREAQAGKELVADSALAAHIHRLSQDEQIRLAELLERMVQPAPEEEAPVEVGP